MAYFNEENTVEQMLINAAGQCGWIYVEPQFVPRLPDEVLVVEWLMEALLALNPITPEQAEQVIYKLRACITSGGASDELITANDKFRKLLFEENSYPFGDNGDNINIRFFAAKDDEYKNRCIVTNQWEYPRKSKEGGKRLDLVYVINGIPMVVGEAKTPVKASVTWADGATDIMHYQKSIPEMFAPNILTFASEGRELQYAGIGCPIDKWGPWFADEDRKHGTLEDVEHNYVSLMTPERLLDIYRFYSVFTGTSGGRKIKIVCRYQQYLGGEAIVQRVLSTYTKGAGPRKGLIWHFQGSGKSWLMVFAAQKLRRQEVLKAPTVVIVDDRIDLEDQITGDFTRAEIPNIDSISSKQELEEKIHQRKILITTIFKFGDLNDGEVIDERDNIILLKICGIILCDCQFYCVITFGCFFFYCEACLSVNTVFASNLSLTSYSKSTLIQSIVEFCVVEVQSDIEIIGFTLCCINVFQFQLQLRAVNNSCFVNFAFSVFLIVNNFECCCVCSKSCCGNQRNYHSCCHDHRDKFLHWSHSSFFIFKCSLRFIIIQRNAVHSAAVLSAAPSLRALPLPPHPFKDSASVSSVPVWFPFLRQFYFA